MTKISKGVYQRRLSSTELKEGYLLITKDALSLFPEIGQPFLIRVKDKEFETRIRAKTCSCMGPCKPREHFHLDTSEFQSYLPEESHNLITITRQSGGDYLLNSGSEMLNAR